MTRVGFSVYGRPVIHEYCSNGIFNDVNLNSESYLELPNGVFLGEGQRIAILKRYRDANGVEVLSVFVNDYAISTNNRLGAFVGSGVAFVGRPTAKLIITTLRELHHQAYSLIDPKTKKFKESKIDCTRLRLPDPNATGYFYESYPKKYQKKAELNIGVCIAGNFFGNLMTAVQGFMYNTSYHGATTAYICEDQSLLQQIVPKKYIYKTYHLLDFSHYFKLKEDKTRSLDRDFSKKKGSLDEVERSIKDKKGQIDEQNRKLKEIDGKIQLEGKKLKNEEERIANLQQKLLNLKEEQNQLEQAKTTNFENALETTGFKSEKEKYEREIESAKNLQYEKENLEQTKENKKNKEKLESLKRKLFRRTIALLLMIIIFLIVSGALVYIKRDIFNGTTSTTSTETKNSQSAELVKETVDIDLPKEYTANEFLALDSIEKEEQKEKLDIVIEKLEKLEKVGESENNTAQSFLKRNWNFREVLDAGDENNIDIGLERVVRIKKIYKKFGEEHELFSSKYLIKDLKYITKEITFKSNNANAILIEYLLLNNNIYKENDIKEDNKKGNNNISEVDPILFMHFRWILFHLTAEKEKEKDLLKTNKKKHIIPIVN
ncbi:MAG: hypothetical protein ACTH6S_11705 [Mesonia sp.]|uniref:hypothetical protein n=1 Tax=Mesonia sp. TaxID=1960830 RepID=UPI003F9C0971